MDRIDQAERDALVLGALDAAIANLSTVRDLLAVTLLQGVQPIVVEDRDEETGECLHRNTIALQTMGVETIVCGDCEKRLDVGGSGG